MTRLDAQTRQQIAAVKVTCHAPVHLLPDAMRAFNYAYHNSTFSGGFALIARGAHSYAVKRNKAGYTVWHQGEDI